LNSFEIAKNKIKNKYRFGPTAILLLLYTDKFHREFPTGREKMVCYEASWKILSQVCDDRTGLRRTL